MTRPVYSVCEACGKPKGGFKKRINHSKCSKILQDRYKSENDKRGKHRIKS